MEPARAIAAVCAADDSVNQRDVTFLKTSGSSS